MGDYFCDDLLNLASLLLPGNVVYSFNTEDDQIFDYTIDIMEIRESQEKGFTIHYLASHKVSECVIDRIGFYVDDIGKTVFIYREDCERRSN